MQSLWPSVFPYEGGVLYNFMNRNKIYPLKHVSIRVPWHDRGWNGTVCKNPKKNSACLILKNCAMNRDDERENQLAGSRIDQLQQVDFPPCVRERGTFMSEYPFTYYANHPYKDRGNKLYQHFKETPLRQAPFSASGVPFFWMQRDKVRQKAEHYGLDLDLSREPELGFDTIWLQEYSNQKTVLNCFFEHLEINNSLCFFYAKEVPFVETSDRVLIGVGRVKYVGDGVEYEYEAQGALRSMLWEHQIQHSIRPDFKDGFLLPYHEAIEYANEHPGFDPAEIAVLTPPDKRIEFSYATEHVSHDTAIRTLLECVKSLEKARELKLGNRDWEEQINWIQARINELEILRGPYPGLGSALSAFSVERGHFVAREILEQTDGEKIWEHLEQIFEQPEKNLSHSLAKYITPMLQKRWQINKKKPESKKIELLQLLSRFELTIEQAKIFFVDEEREKYKINLSDQQMLDNPYLIFEQGDRLEEPVSFWTIDLGMYPRQQYQAPLLPLSVNISDPLDPRRIRALTVQQLLNEAQKGNTLLPQKDLVLKIREMSLSPPCEITGDIYEISEDYFPGALEKSELEDKSIAYQLKKLYEIGKIIEDTVIKRKSGKRHKLNINWKEVLSQHPYYNEKSEIQQKAKEEQAAALQQLAESRISVLTGSAGTGKTTLLSILCEQDEIKKDGVLFLAPTGKARVRLQEAASKAGAKAYTLAQFLNQYNRYDGRTGRYETGGYERCSQYGTVIVDESSMLTEEMMGVLFDALEGVKRYIFVGDHRQLPPIGAGRPFVDIVNYLKPDNVESMFPRVGQCFAELTVTHRQTGVKGKNTYWQDILLAKWFSGNPLDSCDDIIFQDLLLGKYSDRLKVVFWQYEEELETKLKETLVEELNLNGIEDLEGFNKSLGSYDGKYFNDTRSAEYFSQPPAVDKLDDWQILSPVRRNVNGTNEINRLLHNLYRKDLVRYCSGYKSKYPPKLPKPLGNEEIVYGDKVINVRNTEISTKRVYPKDGLNYIANGEMGLVVGQFKRKKDTYQGQPQFTEVEFSSQKGYKYTFYSRDFTEEGEAPLELAYAITVHKAQGSAFKTTFVIIPDPCFNLSREMLYTALTRQREKVIIFFQGKNLLELKKYTSPVYSETCSRLTNLFARPSVTKINGRYLEKYLIHCASDNTLLRSKSELIIYEKLLNEGFHPLYERELTLGGVTRIPDFTIIDDNTGNIYYWEHCGMITDPSYRKRWEEKKRWYYQHGILPLEENGGPNGTLIVTIETPNQGISLPDIEKIIKQIRDK